MVIHSKVLQKHTLSYMRAVLNGIRQRKKQREREHREARRIKNKKLSVSVITYAVKAATSNQVLQQRLNPNSAETREDEVYELGARVLEHHIFWGDGFADESSEFWPSNPSPTHRTTLLGERGAFITQRLCRSAANEGIQSTHTPNHAPLHITNSSALLEPAWNLNEHLGTDCHPQAAATEDDRPPMNLLFGVSRQLN
jgi:hypothetical protein